MWIRIFLGNEWFCPFGWPVIQPFFRAKQNYQLKFEQHDGKKDYPYKKCP